jgi:hypothetical protein
VTPTRSQESKHGARITTAASVEAAWTPSGPLTGRFAQDIARGRWDIEFFALRFLGIRLHPGQLDFAHAVLMRDMTGWRPRYLDIALSAGNRAGKTLIETICHFHSAFYKMGKPPPKMSSATSISKWNAAPYEWYHLAIAQETAELAYVELVRILSGNHEAQYKGCPLVDELGSQVVDTAKKYRGEYPWTQIHPVFGGGTIHYRTTGEKAIGSLGKDMDGISYDECPFDPNFEFVVHEVLHMRRLSTGGQLWLVGTATEGLTAFADAWYEGDPDSPDRKPNKVSLRMSTRANIGYGVDQQMFERLVHDMPPELVPQNIDGLFLEGRSSFFAQSAVDASFVDEMPEMDVARSGHRYVQGVDPALTYDSTWSIVLDATDPDRVTGVSTRHQTGRTTGPVIAALVTAQHMAYSGVKGVSCQTGVDTTGFGGALFRDSLPITIRSVEFGGSRGRKLKLLINLKRALETSRLRFPRSGPWLTLRRQLLGYRLDDKKLQTDAVMALAVAWDMVRFAPDGAANQPFDYFGATAGGVQSSRTPPPLTHVSGRRVAASTSVSEMLRNRG